MHVFQPEDVFGTENTLGDNNLQVFIYNMFLFVGQLFELFKNQI
jgi:hypothetical protein